MPDERPADNSIPDGAYDGVRALVTGGTGFIGAHLVEALVERGADVTVLDDLSSSDTAHLAPLIDRYPARVRFVYGSVLEPEALIDACEGRELCFHLAAIASVPASIREPQRTYDVNTLGTVRVAEACREAGVKRIVNSSTSAVYAPTAGAHAEDDRPDPSTPYGASKLGAEHALSSHATSYAIDCVSLRYFNVVGPRQREGGAYAAVVPAFVGAMQREEPCTIFGSGRQTRDFIPVDEAVRANLMAGVRRQPLKGTVLNVGSGIGTSVRELHDLLRALIGRPLPKPLLAHARDGDVDHSVADTSHASEVLGFACARSIEDALRDVLVSEGITPVESPVRR